MRKLTFNIHGDVSNVELAKMIADELPDVGIIAYTYASGRRLCVSKRENRQTDIYDVWHERNNFFTK